MFYGFSFLIITSVLVGLNPIDLEVVRSGYVRDELFVLYGIVLEFHFLLLEFGFITKLASIGL